MTPAEQAAAASRLCAACGMCLQWVMFYHVRLQPGDSPKELSALGLKLKRRKGGELYPAAVPGVSRIALLDLCGAPGALPALFACRQLQRVSEGAITEAAALESIQEARRRVAEVEEMLARAGRTSVKRPLFKRYEKVMAVPVVDAASEPGAVELRDQLTLAMHGLDVFLDEEFRVLPSAVAEA
ncbi:MAG: hypothetical protein WDN28_12780 [Chthoniobacter sp.]